MPRYVEHFEEHQFLYLVTRWVKESTLAVVMKHSARGGYLNEVDMQEPARQLLTVLQAVHGQGYIHNAITYRNIFVEKSSMTNPLKNKVKLGGFSKAT